MILIGTDDGIYRWIGGGAWPVFHSLQDHAVIGLASVGGGALVTVDGGGVVRESRDNGLSWRELPLPQGAGRPTAVAMLGTAPAVVLATKPLALAQRELGSATAWLPLGAPRIETMSPGVTPSVRGLTATRGEAPVWLAAVAGAGLWRSTDAGASWTACPGLPTDVFAIRPAPTAPATVAVATSDGCWISTDAGQTWQDRSKGLEQARYLRAVEVHPEDPHYLLAGAAPHAPAEVPASPRGRAATGFALYESRDGGASWSHVLRGFPERLEFDTIHDIRFDPANPELAVVAFASGELWKTRNGCDWWEPFARQIKAARVLCATP